MAPSAGIFNTMAPGFMTAASTTTSFHLGANQLIARSLLTVPDELSLCLVGQGRRRWTKKNII